MGHEVTLEQDTGNSAVVKVNGEEYLSIIWDERGEAIDDEMLEAIRLAISQELNRR